MTTSVHTILSTIAIGAFILLGILVNKHPGMKTPYSSANLNVRSHQVSRLGAIVLATCLFIVVLLIPGLGIGTVFQNIFTGVLLLLDILLSILYVRLMYLQYQSK